MLRVKPVHCGFVFSIRIGDLRPNEFILLTCWACKAGATVDAVCHRPTHHTDQVAGTTHALPDLWKSRRHGLVHFPGGVAHERGAEGRLKVAPTPDWDGASESSGPLGLSR